MKLLRACRALIVIVGMLLVAGCTVAGDGGLAETTPAGVLQPASGAPLVLVEDGNAAATIVIPDDADSWTKMAADWVQEYVEKVSGAQLSLVPESKAPSGQLVSVGHTRMAAEAGVTADGLKFDGCKMVVRGNVLFLIGRDVAPQHPSYGPIPKPDRKPWDYIPIILKGHQAPAKIGAKGTCRAVTFFLEEVCGIRWLVPTPQGTLIRKRGRIAVPRDLDKKFEPWMMYHSNRLLYGDPRSEPAAYANNYRVAVKLYSRGGHTYPVWVPASNYVRQHPEYFVLVNGKRTGVGNHLCASNREVRQIILREIQSLFDSGFDLVQLDQSDGYQPCQCAECRELSNHTGARDEKGELKIEHPGEPMLELARWVAEQCLEKYPGRYIHLLVYGPTAFPSKKFRTFPKNVLLEFASSASPELIGRWEGRTVTGGTVYTPWHWTDYGIGIGVKLTYIEAADIMKYYKKQGITGIHSGGGQCWGLQGPTYYVFGKMMGDPDLDPKELLREYCGGLYGPAAELMMDFFERLHMQSDKELILNQTFTASERFMLYYPPTRLQVLDDLLKRAERAAQTERQKNWIRMTRDEFDYIQLVTKAIYLYRAYQINKDPGDLSQLKSAVAAFDAYRKRIVHYDGDYVFDYFPGHGVLCNVLTRGQGQGGYGSDWTAVRKRVNLNDLSGTDIGVDTCSIDKPFTLNFKSADIEGSFRIQYTKNPPKADGKVGEAEWQNAPPVFMRGTVQTEIRGLYDDENLYIAYICEEPRKEGPKGQDIKRDNPICFMDIVELFVDPESSIESRRYYHFLVGATPNAIMDLREGFKTLRDQDTSWNAPGFHYGFHKDMQKKVWSIEMVLPFKDINATAPQAGDVWLGNLAREGHGLHQWSKGGTAGFCNPKSFGKFRFEK